MKQVLFLTIKQSINPRLTKAFLSHQKRVFVPSYPWYHYSRVSQAHAENCIISNCRPTQQCFSTPRSIPRASYHHIIISSEHHIIASYDRRHNLRYLGGRCPLDPPNIPGARCPRTSRIPEGCAPRTPCTLRDAPPKPSAS